MRPEILQNLSQIFIFIGILLTAIGGYGHFHYGNKIEQKRGIVIDEKLNNIPLNINSTSDKNTVKIITAVKNSKQQAIDNSDKVLIAIKDVKQTVDEIASSDGSNIKEISYPSSGEFGINILDKNIIKYKVGTYSMRVEMPKNQEIIVKISGKNWVFPAFQSIPGWRHFDYETEDTKTIRKFKTLKAGSLDFDMRFTGADVIELLVFENESKVPTWQKTIIVEE
jgi:hypothetical protein